MTHYFLATESLLVVVIGAIATILGSLLGGGTVYGILKLGPERKKLTVESDKISIDIAEAALSVSQGVLKSVKDDYDRLADDLAVLKMQSIARERENEDCQQRIQELQNSVSFLQRQLEHHGRVAQLARRKAHLAIHTMGYYEIHVDNILDVIRKLHPGNVPVTITEEMRTHQIREAFQREMAKLEYLETKDIEQAEPHQ